LYGFKKVKDTLPGQNIQNKSVEEIIKFFESIEDFKHCEDEIRSAALIDSLNLTLDHVPGHMLKSEEVIDRIYFLNLLFLPEILIII
jgi:60 kDa SS-A/Ro ribonucleoprotein